jgi:hypothetical protein
MLRGGSNSQEKVKISKFKQIPTFIQSRGGQKNVEVCPCIAVV